MEEMDRTYTFRVVGKKDVIAGIEAVTTYVFEGTVRDALMVDVGVEYLPVLGDVSMRRYLARPIDGDAAERKRVYVTGEDLEWEIEYIAEALSEEIADMELEKADGSQGESEGVSDDSDDRCRISPTRYYRSVNVALLSYPQVDALLGAMVAVISAEDATPDDPYFFSAVDIARAIIAGECLGVSAGDLLLGYPEGVASGV